jgi:hypothetical protein
MEATQLSYWSTGILAEEGDLALGGAGTLGHVRDTDPLLLQGLLPQGYLHTHREHFYRQKVTVT